MYAEVERVGGLPVCSQCGSKEFYLYKWRGGDKAQCKLCGQVVHRKKLRGARYITDGMRVQVAIEWLSWEKGWGVTRREIAAHLGCSKSPTLIRVLTSLQECGYCRAYRAPSRFNGRETVYYLHWTMPRTELEARYAGGRSKVGLKPPVSPNWGGRAPLGAF